MESIAYLIKALCTVLDKRLSFPLQSNFSSQHPEKKKHAIIIMFNC